MYKIQIYSHSNKEWIDCNPENGWVGIHNNIEDAHKEREEIKKYYYSKNSMLPTLVRIV